MTEENGYRSDIDGLRAIAVLPVVLFHLALGFPAGFLGVDVFFVVSGYLITDLIGRGIRERRFSLARFYERRIRRIGPPLFATIAASAVAAYLLFMPPDLVLFGRSQIAAALMASNLEFWRESGYFDAAAQAKPLLHTWSLGVEEQFYLVFPLLLLTVHRWLPGRERRVLVALTAASLLLAVWWNLHRPIDAFYLTPARFWELGAGAILAFGAGRRIGGRRAAALTLAGLAAIMAPMLLLTGDPESAGLSAIPVCLGTALIIYAGRTENPARRLLSSAPLVFVGRISYPLYLSHWPLKVFLQYAQGRALDGGQSVLVLAVSLALATLSWRLLERPIRARRVLGKPVPLTAAASVCAVAACVAGIAFVSREGLPSRLPADVRAVYDASHDGNPYAGRACFIDTDGIGRMLSDDDIRRGKLCRTGVAKDRAPSYLIWGDSHAPAMAPAIVTSAAAFGLGGAVVGHGGCAPLIDYGRFGGRDARKQDCIDFNAAVLDYVRRSHVPLIFLVARWPREVLGSEYGNEGLFFDPALPYANRDRSNIVAASLDRTIAALIRAGSRPVLVMDVPEPGYNVPYAMARALLHKTTVALDPPRSAIDDRQHATRTVFSSAAAKYGLALIDPTSDFCDALRCRVSAGGIPLYVDADHMTRTAAIRLSHLYDPVFAAFRAALPPDLPPDLRPPIEAALPFWPLLCRACP